MVILRASRTDAPQRESNADSPLLISSIENSTLRHFHQVEKWGLIRSRICRTRTHDFQSWGRGFESLRAHQANQAQLEFMLPSPDLLGSAWEAGAAMSLDDIVTQIIRLLRARDQIGGHFQQEPYKGDFFLFVAAYDGGLLKQSAPKSLKLDSLISIISSRDPDVFDGKTWPMFSAAWPEWDYAWTHAKRGASLDDDEPGG
jgi:hypothetical protein